MAGRLQIDERLPDVFGPSRPLQRVDASIEIGVDLAYVEPMPEITAEPISVLEDRRNIVVSGEKCEAPDLVIENWGLMTKSSVR